MIRNVLFVERNIRTERLEITMITVNAMGDTCPIPVVKTKMQLKSLMVQVLWRHWWTMRSQFRT